MPPPRQRTASSTDQSAWLRRRALVTCLRRVSRSIEDRCLQSPRTMSTTGISRTSLRFSEVALGASKVALGCCVAGWPSSCEDSFRESLARSLTRMGQPSFPRSGALAGGAFQGFRWLRHPPARLLAPRLVTPTLVTRTPSVAGAWLDGLEEPISPDVFTSFYMPTRRARLRETRGQAPRFRKTSRQDGFP